MTTPSTPRKAGPFTGDGSQDSWPFTFKVFSASDILVTALEGGAERTLAVDADYSVTLNTNQDTSPGGTVTYALADGDTLVITGGAAYEQALDIPGGGNFNPTALEAQLDRIVMQIQQLSEQLGRALVAPVTGGEVELPSSTPGLAEVNVFHELYTATGNGSTTEFDVGFSPASAFSVDVAVAGLVQTPGTDWSADAGTTITFTSAPPSGVPILVRGFFYTTA